MIGILQQLYQAALGEVTCRFHVLAALSELAEQQQVSFNVVEVARESMGIMSDKPNQRLV